MLANVIHPDDVLHLEMGLLPTCQTFRNCPFFANPVPGWHLSVLSWSVFLSCVESSKPCSLEFWKVTKQNDQHNWRNKSHEQSRLDYVAAKCPFEHAPRSSTKTDFDMFGGSLGSFAFGHNQKTDYSGGVALLVPHGFWFWPVIMGCKTAILDINSCRACATTAPRPEPRSAKTSSRVTGAKEAM